MNFIEVCSGAGGLSKGFIDEGFVPLLLNDNDKSCCETLKNNHANVNVLHGSMKDIDLTKYNKVDILMGGIPCQSFSQAGKRKGLDDERGGLMIHFIKMISILKPKVFLIENVKGLKSHNNGKTLEYILAEIKKINKYSVNYSILNANDYNVPQKRERLIIVGVRGDIKKTYVFPKKCNHKPLLKDVLTNCPSSEGFEYNERKYEIMRQVPQGGCWVDLPIAVQKKYLGNSYNSGGGKRGMARRLSMNEPSLTLLTSPSQKQTERCHPIETRPLQILEYSRIQTFPDNYKFSGSLSQRYKQIGNAVPVNLAKHLAKSISDLFV